MSTTRTRTVTHFAVSPGPDGTPVTSEELASVLNCYLGAEADPKGGAIATQDHIKITTHQVEATTSQEQRERHLLSLVLAMLFKEPIDVAASPEQILKSIGSLPDICYLADVVRMFRADGFEASYILEATDN